MYTKTSNYQPPKSIIKWFMGASAGAQCAATLPMKYNVSYHSAGSSASCSANKHVGR